MFEQLVDIICNYVEVEPENVYPESRFMEDLGFTSFDFMSMLGEIEETFDVELEQEKSSWYPHGAGSGRLSGNIVSPIGRRRLWNIVSIIQSKKS